MSCLAIIPAKGTSERLPRKNYLDFDEEPLVVRAIRTAQACNFFDQIFVSTDNNQDRQHLLSRADIFFRDFRTLVLSRPKLAHSGCAQVCLDILAVRNYPCECFALLVPSSPLRTSNLLLEMWEDFSRTDRCDCLMSFGPGGGRHDGTAIFCRTEAFVKALDFYAMRPVPYFVSAELSCDVNTEKDLRRAEEMLRCRERSA